MGKEGKVALVTGGSGGLGSVHCLSLGRAGYNVAVAAHTHLDKAEEVAAKIRAMGRKSIALKMDVSDFNDVQAALKRIEKELGPVDVLVSNAAYGIVRAITIVNMKIEDWERDVAVNLTGAFNMIRAVAPAMTANGFGRIVNITSINGLRGKFGQANYAAAKSGIIAASRALAAEVARLGVRVNVVAPGLIETDMTSGLPMENIKQMIPMARIGRPEEVAKVVRFLCSEDASYITGQVISVNGGMF